MGLESFRRAFVPSCLLAHPVFRVSLELADVVELGPKLPRRTSTGCEVFTGLTDIGIRTWPGGEVSRAVAGAEAGLQELRRDPLHFGGTAGRPAGARGMRLRTLPIASS